MRNETKQKLLLDLDRRFVRQREGGNGKMLDYIDNHYAISMANEIFDFDWCSETLKNEHIATVDYVDKFGKVKKNVGYRAIVRVTVDGIFKDGSGYGDGIDTNEIKAHELALKEAETDARKRALMQFGNPLGLELYGKDSSFKNAAAMRKAAKEIEDALSKALTNEDLDNISVEFKSEFNMMKISQSEPERMMYQQLVTEAKRLREEFNRMDKNETQFRPE